MSPPEPEGAETVGRESLRAFVAVAPGAPLRNALGHARASLESAKFAPGLRWVRPENLHLTLRFLGEVALASLPALRSALQEILRAQERFELAPTGVALFPNSRRPRALAATLPADERLQALAARVESAVRDCGFPSEPRRFRPHITLARFRRGQRAGALPEIRLEAAPLEVHAVALMRSELAPTGARYTTLENFALATSAAVNR